MSLLRKLLLTYELSLSYLMLSKMIFKQSYLANHSSLNPKKVEVKINLDFVHPSREIYK